MMTVKSSGALCIVSATVTLLFASVGVSAAPADAAAATPAWSLTVSALPTNFAPESSEDEYILFATNDGNETTGATTVTVTDTVSKGLTVTSVRGHDTDTGRSLFCTSTGVALTCSTTTIGTTPVAAGDALVVRVRVSVSPGAPSSVTSSAAVTGGGALAGASARVSTAISSSPAPFGIAAFSAAATNADGTLDNQAGSHAYEATASFTLDSSGTAGGLAAAAPLKDVAVALPAGFVGNPQVGPQCTQGEFEHKSATRSCPLDSQVGQVTLLFATTGLAEPYEEVAPVFNLAPVDGHTAEFGFYAGESGEVPVVVVASVRSSSDYGITTKITNLPTGIGGRPIAPLLSAFTFWGVPADPSHNAQRGLFCLPAVGPGLQGQCYNYDEGGFTHPPPLGVAPAGVSSGAAQIPFLANPTSCQSGPLQTVLSVDSWPNPGSPATATADSPQPSGCDELSFDPMLELTPESQQAGAASGYEIKLEVPQGDGQSAPASAELKRAVVTLPEGVSVSPSAATGLEGCSDSQIGIDTQSPVKCPNGSKVGTVTVRTPLLPGPLEGSVYVGDPLPNDPYRIFLNVEGFGVVVRLEGKVHADPSTGQLTSTFEEDPQLPFSDLELHLFGGPQAALSNPPGCGTATTTSELTPWSAGPGGTGAATPSSSFEVSFDGHGAGCPTPQQFAPVLSAGSQGAQAGAFSPFLLTLSRTDEDQYLAGISAHAPPGLLGMLSEVALCPEPQASLGTCAPDSLIGRTTVGAGPGPEPFYLGGRLYLTGPYKGAPFGLSVVVPAIAGPYNLGTVVVRSAINVDPNTAALTITSDPFPQILQGIPLQLRTINVIVDRPNFMFNPTRCSEQPITAAVASTQGSSASVSSPFAAQGCANLPFKPTLTASTLARTSKANGASLSVKVTSGPGQANIAKVSLQLPIALPSRLTTLQKACTEAQFNANPSACPAASVIGTARALTPVLNVPLTGPAILVSHGGAAFPDVEFVLQGQGVTIVLDGKTQITNGITYSRFETLPDAPVSSFEAVLPEGPYSILSAYLPAGANGSLCAENLTMPTTLTGQNGARIQQTTRIAVTGCPVARPRMKIRKTVLKGNTLMVSIATSQKGTVKISGTGLLRVTEHSVAAGAHTIDVPLTKAGVARRRRRARASVRVTLTVGKQSVVKTTSVRL
jgi:hypothetical protein